MRFTAIVTLFVALLSAGAAMAASDAPFPKDWQSWPVHHSGAIPSNKVAIPADLPPIVRETFKTYNWVNQGQGTAYNVRINPTKAASAKAAKGKFADGPSAVLELVDIKVLLVTDHLLGEPQYGAWSFDGKDLSGAHPSLAPKTCTTCHSGYGEACIGGVCTK